MEENQNKQTATETVSSDTVAVTREDDVLAGKSKLRGFVLGVFIGLAIIAPGISGSTIAIILGLYTAMLYANGHLFSKDFKRCFAFLLPLGIGAVVGFLGGFFAIQAVFGPYVFQMVSFFVGLMAGAFPALLREIKGKVVSARRGLLFAVGILIPIAIALVSFALLPESSSTETFTDFPISRYFLYLPLGFLVSVTQVIPGLSATAVLMAFGQFGLILNSVHLDYILENPQVLILYASLAIGFFAGVFALSRLLSDVLEKHRTTCFFLVVGLSLGSIVSMLLSSDMMECYTAFAAEPTFPWPSVLAGVGFLALGFAISFLLVLYEKKHDISPS